MGGENDVVAIGELARQRRLWRNSLPRRHDGC
jgi:hypothetical protein